MEMPPDPQEEKAEGRVEHKNPALKERASLN